MEPRHPARPRRTPSTQSPCASGHRHIRNGTPRFCSTTCQNRIKAAAHRARQRQD
ncbi:CGNR zinc finger domain-containing protein [Streptomyces sp. NPDC005930]|uniref:CGNR zinc finger domain-containing protein n=1 Tax=Streptomyces sp. NPDC005930 TaxID=3364736 RepID=UPI0036AFC348